MSAPTIDPVAPPEQARRTGLAKWIRRLAIPIILGWIALIVVLNATVPQLEVVGQMQSVSMSPKEAPSVIAMTRVGEVFDEFHSDSSAMIVLEGDQPLGDDAHRFYNEMIDKLEADTTHVEHVEGFSGRPADGSRSAEPGRESRVRAGISRRNQGEELANESVKAVQAVIAGLSPPAGVKVFVTGGTARSRQSRISPVQQ